MRNFLKSFLYAFRGIRLALKERNFKIHILAFISVCIAGFYFQIDRFEWLVIIGISALVMSLEIINTSIEQLCDLYSTNHNEYIKSIKDLSAGAVLLASILALILAVIIFYPKL